MMIFKVNYVILIIAVKNYNYDYSFFVYKEFSPYEEHKRSEQMLTPKIIHNI